MGKATQLAQYLRSLYPVHRQLHNQTGFKAFISALLRAKGLIAAGTIMKASSKLAVLLLVGSLCAAQELTRYELSGGVSYGGIDTSDVRSPKGFAGSFATNVNRWLSMETSVGAQFDTQTAVLSGSTVSLNTGFYSFLSGPRISYRRGHIAPFGHGLFGWARSLDYGKATFNPTNATYTIPYGNALGAAAGGGIDYWITRRIAIRTQGDYFLTQPDGTFGFHMTNNFRIVGGIVFSFGTPTTMTARMSKPHTPAPRRTQPDVIAKETPETTTPRPVPAPTSTQASINQPAASVPIQPAAAVAKQTSTPAPLQPLPTAQPTQIPGTTIIQSSAVVAKQTSTPAPAAAVAPKQDPFAPPAKPASPVANTSPAPAPMATAVVRPAPAAPAQADPQPFSLGEYARKLRQKRESQPKDWN